MTLENVIQDATRRAHARNVTLGYSKSVQGATTPDEIVNAASTAIGSLSGLGNYGDAAAKQVQNDADMRLKVMAPDKNITLGDIAMQRAQEYAKANPAAMKTEGKTVAQLAHEYYLMGTQQPLQGTKTVGSPTGPREVAFQVPKFGQPAITSDIGPAVDQTGSRESDNALRDMADKARIAKGKVKQFEIGGTEKLKKGEELLNSVVSQTGVSQDDPNFFEELAKLKMDPTLTAQLREVMDYTKAKRDLAGYTEGLKGHGYGLDEESKLIKLSDIKPPKAKINPPLNNLEGNPVQTKREVTSPGPKKVGRFILRTQ